MSPTNANTSTAAAAPPHRSPPPHTGGVLLPMKRPSSSIRTSRSGSIIGESAPESTESRTGSAAATRKSLSNNRARATAITVVEPIREKPDPVQSKPQKKQRSPTGKVLKGLGDGIGFVLYMLCICCVLSGDQGPVASKARKGYYYQHDDGSSELGGARVRKVESNGSASVGSKAGAERAERVR